MNLVLYCLSVFNNLNSVLNLAEGIILLHL